MFLRQTSAQLYLVHPGPSLVEQSSCLNVFWYQLAPHTRNLGPTMQDLQRQVLVGLHRLVWNIYTRVRQTTQSDSLMKSAAFQMWLLSVQMHSASDI